MGALNSQRHAMLVAYDGAEDGTPGLTRGWADCASVTRRRPRFWGAPFDLHLPARKMGQVAHFLLTTVRASIV